MSKLVPVTPPPFTVNRFFSSKLHLVINMLMLTRRAHRWLLSVTHLQLIYGSRLCSSLPTGTHPTANQCDHEPLHSHHSFFFFGFFHQWRSRTEPKRPRSQAAAVRRSDGTFVCGGKMRMKCCDEDEDDVRGFAQAASGPGLSQGILQRHYMLQQIHCIHSEWISSYTRLCVQAPVCCSVCVLSLSTPSWKVNCFRRMWCHSESDGHAASGEKKKHQADYFLCATLPSVCLFTQRSVRTEHVCLCLLN